MLIDDRQILSVDVEKILRIARVAKTNNYADLDGIPTEFPPTEHTHRNASSTESGFMSKEDYNKLHDLKNFSNIKVLKGADNVTTIKPTKIDDTLTITAGDNVIITYDETNNNIGISVDYSKEIESLEGEKGKPGDKGDNGITWRPNYSLGKISYIKDENNLETPIDSFNIKGEKGDKGSDALPVDWNNLLGKPAGEYGKALFINGNNPSGVEADSLLKSFNITSDKEEIQMTDVDLLNNLKEFYLNYLKKFDFCKINELGNVTKLENTIVNNNSLITITSNEKNISY